MDRALGPRRKGQAAGVVKALGCRGGSLAMAEYNLALNFCRRENGYNLLIGLI